MLAAPLHAEVELFVDDANAWRKAIGQPLTEIDWYPHWLGDGELPQSSPIPVDYYIDLGIRTGFAEPSTPEVLEPRPAFDMTYQDDSLPPYFMAGSSSNPDPDGAHLWFSSPVNGLQLSLLESHTYSYNFFPAKFYLDGVLVGEIFNIPSTVESSLGILTDFQFDHMTAIAALGHLEFPTIETDTSCPDITNDGNVNVSDLLMVIDQWGLTKSPADVDQNGIVNVSDLLEIVGNWGPCA